MTELSWEAGPTKTCSKCKKLKPYGEFYRRSDRSTGIQSRCKECSNADHVRYTRENSEKMLAYQRKYLQERPEVVRSRHLKYKFGMTKDDYDQMLAAQGGVCKVCGASVPGGRGAKFHIDHDRACCPGYKSCGECIRGLLCSGCNCALGLVDDSSDRLRRLADYVDKDSGSMRGLWPTLNYSVSWTRTSWTGMIPVTARCTSANG